MAFNPFFVDFDLNQQGIFNAAVVSGLYAPGGSLVLQSTSASIKGKIYFGAAQTSVYDETSNRFGIATTVPTHSLSLGLGNTGIVSYNNAAGLDNGVTNYERVRQYWNSNIYTIATETGGTGIQRVMALTANQRTLSIGNFAVSGIFNFNAGTSNPNISVIGINNTYNASSGMQYAFADVRTINQSSTAGYVGYWASVYELSVGSGQRLLMDLGTNTAVNGGGTHTSKFSVNSSGILYIFPGTAPGSPITGQFYSTGTNLYWVNSSNVAQRLDNGPNGAIYNQTTQQAGASFNIDGTGTLNRLNLTGAVAFPSTFTSTTGMGLVLSAATYTSATSTGAIARGAVHYIGVPTLAAGAATVLDGGYTLYIEGAPVNGTNTTISNKYSVFVNTGQSFFGGPVSVNGTLSATGFVSYTGAVPNLYSGGYLAVSSTNSIYALNGVSNTAAKVYISGQSANSVVPGTLSSAANLLIGAGNLSTGNSGTHNIFAALAVVPFSGQLNSAGVLTNGVTLYIDGPPPIGINKYSFWLRSGASLFGGTVTTNDDIEITTVGKGIIIKSPDGTRWRLTPSNAGAATFVAA